MRDGEVERLRDRTLIRRAREGDRSAFEELHRLYKDRILNYLYRFFGNRAAAQDITQETFIQVYTHLASYRPIGTVSSWIFTIATNLARSELRGIARRKKWAIDGAVTDDGNISLEDTIASEADGPGDIAKKHELEAAIQEAIDMLSPKLRAVFILCRIEGIPYREAAGLVKCNLFTLKMRLYRAQAQLLRKIQWNKFV